MHSLALKLRQFLYDESGPTAVEYAVMLCLIIIACLAGITTIGIQANTTFSNVSDSLKMPTRAKRSAQAVLHNPLDIQLRTSRGFFLRHCGRRNSVGGETLWEAKLCGRRIVSADRTIDRQFGEGIRLPQSNAYFTRLLSNGSMIRSVTHARFPGARTSANMIVLDVPSTKSTIFPRASGSSRIPRGPNWANAASRCR